MTRVSERFTRELSRVRELSREFAASHPQSAAALAEDAEDPDIERLLAGFAFLCADLRAEIDGAAASFAKRLLESLGPQWIRPLPAATVVELRPDLRVLRSRQPIPRGKELRARPVDGTAARFTTAADVDLMPLEIVGVTLDRQGPMRAVLNLELRASEAGAALVPSLDQLRLFIHDRDPAAAARLRNGLVRSCTTIRATDSDGERPPVAAAIRSPFAALEPRLLPWPEATPPAIRVLVEGLAYPDFAGFVDVTGLGSLALTGPAFTLHFELSAADDGPSLSALPSRLSPANVRLHCAPALNLFPTTAEPFDHVHGDRPRLLRADGVAARHMEVFALTEVTVDGRAAQPRICGVLPPGGDGPTFEVDRATAGDDAQDCRLAIDDAGATRSAPALVSTRLLCTNRHLPAQLEIGALGHGPRHLLLAEATNITPITPPRRPSLDVDRAWALVDQLGPGRRPLATVGALRELLALYAPSRPPGAPRRLLGGEFSEALVDLRRRRAYIPRENASIPAIETTLTIDRGGLASEAEVELLGELLAPLFADEAGFEATSLLTIQLNPTGERRSWPQEVP
ncbi:MAG: type VI secretion system baseplate subunit TssF [Myxococcales bacterium]|nr:type VI secretion system baseplate subunit TssF [Myxococcales bacterium]